MMRGCCDWLPNNCLLCSSKSVKSNQGLTTNNNSFKTQKITMIIQKDEPLSALVFVEFKDLEMLNSRKLECFSLFHDIWQIETPRPTCSFILFHSPENNSIVLSNQLTSCFSHY